MRYLHICTLFLLCVIVNGCASATIAKNNEFDLTHRHKVAVIEVPNNIKDDFWTIIVAGTYRTQNARPVSEYLEDELMKSGKFEVMERQQLKAIIDEQKLSLSGMVDNGEYVKIGKLASLDGLVILKQGIAGVFWLFPIEHFESTISAKYVNVESGKLMWSGSGKFSSVTILPFVPLWINYERNMVQSLVAELMEEYRK